MLIKLQKLGERMGVGEKGGPGREKGGCWVGRLGRWAKRVVCGQQGTWEVLAVCQTGRTVWEKVDRHGRRLKLVLVVEVDDLGEDHPQGLYSFPVPFA